MNENEKLNLFVAYLALFLLGSSFVVELLRKRRRSKGKGEKDGRSPSADPIYGAEISRRTLLRIAIQYPLQRYLFALLLLLAVLSLAKGYGRMSWGVYIRALMTVGVFPSVVSIPGIVQLIRPLKRLKEMHSFDEDFSGRRLVWCAGAWQYVDKEWFIRIGSGESAVLYAQEIDFEVEPESFNYIFGISGVGAGHYICRKMRFRCVNGDFYTAVVQETASLKQWMQSHLAKKPKEPAKKRKARK